MFFIHPMWDSESQRIGMQKCTPRGYALHAIGESIGFVGLFVLLGTMVFLGWKLFNRGFHAKLLWWLVLPMGIGIVSKIVVEYSWLMALRKQFRYDDQKREASWIEAGEQRTYKYEAEHEIP